MATLFDPLIFLRGLGAYVHAVDTPEGKHIRLTWRHDSRRSAQRKGEVIRARFERLLLMQMDVPPGCQPRTVQQLVAAKKIKVVAGRYVVP